MKIQCNVCNKTEASVYCSSDEAALCDSCDYQVHRANKLASKHYRFKLINPDGKESVNCDVCQEKRAFLFCPQDRAILCRECDASIHDVNEHTKKHDRFLLTGVKLSVKADLYVPPENSLTSGCDLVPDIKSKSSTGKKVVVGSKQVQNTNSVSAATKIRSSGCNDTTSDLGLTSSISEYLMETLPGWRVEDLLDSSSAPYTLSKHSNNGLQMPFSDADILGQHDPMNSLLFLENSTTWASRVPSISVPFSQVPNYSSHLQFTSKQFTNTKGSNNARIMIDDGFTVPQIISPQSSVGFKRSRLI